MGGEENYEAQNGTTASQAAQSQGWPQRITLTIAGFDPSSGAGLTADLKVFAAHGFYGVAAATALTVQSTAGVRRVEPVSAHLVLETLACLADDLPLTGIKIGMLATAANVDAVAEFLESLRDDSLPIVLDPVLCSSSGHALLDVPGVDRLRSRLLPLVTCATPNIEELFLLTGRNRPGGSRAPHREEIAAEAAALAAQFPNLGIVATGGHLNSPDDYVLANSSPPVWLPGEWVETPATHGTGCGYSSALLCGLAAGLALAEAALAAKRYVTQALRAATPMGKGGGSMDHLYASIHARRPSHLQQASRPAADLATVSAQELGGGSPFTTSPGTPRF
jgi:hydroxymethylpyrimidine/phosphomethylpyrimidine kinase